MDRHSSGDLISRIITDIDQFSDGLLLGFTQLFTGVATIAGTICFMLAINPFIALVVIVLSPLVLPAGKFHIQEIFCHVPKISPRPAES